MYILTTEHQFCIFYHLSQTHRKLQKSNAVELYISFCRKRNINIYWNCESFKTPCITKSMLQVNMHPLILSCFGHKYEFHSRNWNEIQFMWFFCLMALLFKGIFSLFFKKYQTYYNILSIRWHENWNIRHKTKDFIWAVQTSLTA